MRFLWLVIVGTVACAAGRPRVEAPPAPSPGVALPPLGTEVVAEPSSETPPRSRSKPVTLRAVDADMRALLVALGEVAGVNLVISPQVSGRVSLALEEVSAEEALAALLDASGLSAPGVLSPPWGPAVFFQPPVLLDTLGAEAISQRFAVSPRLARWIVEQRFR